jgi:DNA-binding LacI/PurR family transcriptional regulator
LQGSRFQDCFEDPPALVSALEGARNNDFAALRYDAWLKRLNQDPLQVHVVVAHTEAADEVLVELLPLEQQTRQDREERLIEQLLRRRPEAIVVTGGNHTPRARRMLENAGIPVIETWDLPETPIDHVIGFSNAQAVRSMVDHFVGRGLTRIAFIGGDVSRDTRGADRRAGFIAAMQAAAASVGSARSPSVILPSGWMVMTGAAV